MMKDGKFINDKHKELYDRFKFMQVEPVTGVVIAVCIGMMIYCIGLFLGVF
jgi:hypothetical protein